VTDSHAGGRPPRVALLAPWRLGAALGVHAAIAPAIVYVSLGYFVGPNGTSLLSAGALRHLDIVIWLALALLGVFAGLGLKLQRTSQDLVPLAAATVEALVTVGAVAGATMWLTGRWTLPLANTTASVPLLIGVCAAASAVVVGSARSPALERAARISDLDDVAVILAGAWILSWHAGVSLLDAARTAAVVIPLGAAIAAAGVFLFEQARSDAERGTFVLGVLTLLAGAAAYLSLSPLLIGMVAGLVWRWAPGRADAIIRADLEKLHHPLVVLLLFLAGTTVVWTRLTVWLLVPFVIFRLTGKLLGGWAGARMIGGMPAGELGARLLPCGLIGVALALQFNQMADGPIGAAVVSAVALGAIAFELLTLGALAGEDR
jgi:hypothetical protein